MAQHNELGKKGEKLAIAYLEQKGHYIIETNYRFGRDEVDIISLKDNKVVFVEVKTRVNNFLGEPEEWVSLSKQKRIIRVANHYVVENDVDLEARFDIIGIILNSKETIVNHIEEAFMPGWR